MAKSKIPKRKKGQKFMKGGTWPSPCPLQSSLSSAG